MPGAYVSYTAESTAGALCIVQNVERDMSHNGGYSVVSKWATWESFQTRVDRSLSPVPMHLHLTCSTFLLGHAVNCSIDTGLLVRSEQVLYLTERLQV